MARRGQEIGICRQTNAGAGGKDAGYYCREGKSSDRHAGCCQGINFQNTQKYKHRLTHVACVDFVQ